MNNLKKRLEWVDKLRKLIDEHPQNKTPNVLLQEFFDWAVEREKKINDWDDLPKEFKNNEVECNACDHKFENYCPECGHPVILGTITLNKEVKENE